MTARLAVLFVSAEVAPFSKVGGLGDVAGSLPPAVARLGFRVDVISPWYRYTAAALPEPGPPVYFGRISFSGKTEPFALYRIRRNGVRFWFVDYPPYFQREGIYTLPDGQGYPDNGRRFLFFQLAVTDSLRNQVLSPDVLHVNDHHTALIPFFCRRAGIPLPSLLTLHNLAYQGHLPPEDLAVLPSEIARELQSRAPEKHWVNPLKIGIETADRINTVSPTYARELLSDPALAGEAAAVLKKRHADFSGILNGIDTTGWNPATDPFLAAPYDRKRLAGKRINRTALLNRSGLKIADRKPVFGSVSRLVESKGFDLLLRALPWLVDQGAGLIFLGSGDHRIQKALREAAEKHPEQVFYESAFDEPLAHLIEAGADLFLMPSRFEPCGLNQMYSLRYGTPPVVHRTGGLADSVIPHDRPGGNGFVFAPYGYEEFQSALKESLRCFRDRTCWRLLQQAGMEQDFSWERSAREYKKLYIDNWKSGQNREKT